MERIDKLDRKIIYELGINARQALSRLASLVGTSKQVVDYRMKRLVERGIIKGFWTVIDHSRLGYFSFRVYLKLRNISPAKQQEMLHYLQHHKDIWWLVTIDGDWDIDFVVLVKDVFHYYHIWEEFIHRFMRYIYKHETAVYSHIQEFPKSYLIGKENKSSGIVISSKREEIKVDEIDLKLLQLISTNARMEIVQLAKEVKLDVRTVMKRIKMLTDKKIIAGYSAIIDLNKLGYRHYKILFYLFNTGRLEEMRRFALTHPNIIFLNKTIGGADFELEFQVKDIEEFLKVLNEFKSVFHADIDHHYHFRVIEQYKMIYYPLS
ncbi:MAG: Lrp/AsnC family transcriptional regulator [Nanoarchaeota archaeon]|nr:Lrp/AsnC family transcriptional regulator [Nanoarchaeota archaeon]